MTHSHKTFVALLILMAACFQPLTAQNALLIPSTLTGTDFTLTLDEGTTEFTPGIETETIGYNGSYLGPTLIWQKGTTVNIDVVNNMDENTTTHWHGLHLPAEDDGAGHQLILAGATWSPSFEILDTASTMWYHPHVHMDTMGQVNRGAAGMILIRDESQAALNLPLTYGVDEFPLILQDRQFDGDGQLVVQPFGDIMLVNGTIDPFLDVPAQVVRFHVLNGSNQRFYNLGFDDNRSFTVIGRDGGLFDAPVTVTRHVLAPGQRVDILVDFTGFTVGTCTLMSYASELPTDYAGANGRGGLNGVDFDVLDLNVGDQTASPVTTVPATLVTVTPYTAADVENTRTITMTGGGGGFVFNGVSFDMSVVNETVELDTTESWVLFNDTNTAHPFHIHDIQFYVIRRSTGGVLTPLQDVEAGHKQDTVIVGAGETVTFVTKFDDFADADSPYMYHCHILPHEDGGMMGQFVVVDTSTDDPVTEDPDTSEPTVTDYFVDVSEEVDGWYYSTSLGFFNGSGYPWVFFEFLGWAYAGGDGSGAYWFYLPGEVTWAYTDDVAYPWMYFTSTGNWIYIILDTDPVLLYDGSTTSYREYTY